MGKLATLSELKARLKIEAFDTVDDALLNGLLNLVSGRFEDECNRKFERIVGGTYEFCADACAVIVDRYPVESVSAWHLKNNETDGWVAQTPSYMIQRGCVLSLSVALGASSERGRVTFTGGYVLPGNTPGTGQTALPVEIEQAAVEQAAHWYRERNRLGLQSASGDGGSVMTLPVSVVHQLDLLPVVSAVLKRYERILL